MRKQDVEALSVFYDSPGTDCHADIQTIGWLDVQMLLSVGEVVGADRCTGFVPHHPLGEEWLLKVDSNERVLTHM